MMNIEDSNPFSILKEIKFKDPDQDLNNTFIEDTPENVPANLSKYKLRIWLDKKKRKGKTVSLIKGLEMPMDELKSIAKILKTKLGVGGSVDDGGLLIQTKDRDAIVSILKSHGFTDVLKAGS